VLEDIVPSCYSHDAGGTTVMCYVVLQTQPNGTVAHPSALLVTTVLQLLWSPYVMGQTIIFSSCFFFFLLSFFSSPNLSGRRLHVYHTSAHGVVLVRIWNAGLKCAARGSLQIQDAKNRHLGTIAQFLSGHIFATKARIDNRKKTC